MLVGGLGVLDESRSSEMYAPLEEPDPIEPGTHQAGADPSRESELRKGI